MREMTRIGITINNWQNTAFINQQTKLQSGSAQLLKRCASACCHDPQVSKLEVI